MPNEATRVAALLSGDVDLINAVPPVSFQLLKTKDAINIAMTQDVYTAYLHIDTDREVIPNITAKTGRK